MIKTEFQTSWISGCLSGSELHPVLFLRILQFVWTFAGFSLQGFHSNTKGCTGVELSMDFFWLPNAQRLHFLIICRRCVQQFPTMICIWQHSIAFGDPSAWHSQAFSAIKCSKFYRPLIFVDISATFVKVYFCNS